MEHSSTKLLQKDDIIISARGTVGEMAMIPFPMAFNQSCYGIRGKECIDKSFLYYLLKNNIHKLKAITHGSVFDTITKNTFSEIDINLPDLETQKKTGYLLGLLDDKIELNNRINKNLEEQAQAIFKSWFVDFEPFGGVMPENWRISTLGETTSKFTTGLNPRKNFVLGQGNNYYVTIKNMSDNDIILNGCCDMIDNEALEKINKRSDLKAGDMLFSAVGTIGRVYYIDSTPTNWNINESIFTIRANNLISPEYLYLLLLSSDMQEYAVNSANGSVQKGIRMADLKRYKFNLPNNKVIIKFSEIVKSLISKIKINNNENQRLSALRDTLLSKLMNGEIDVSKI